MVTHLCQRELLMVLRLQVTSTMRSELSKVSMRLKARGSLLMALPNEHQLQFNSYKSAKSLMEAIEKRSMLLMALLNEHLLTFNQYKDAQTLFAAIQTRFGGNEATKKTQKTLLKQMYENFSALSTKSLDSIFNWLQKIVSQLAILGENISQENLNLKFLKSLPSEWNTHVVVWRNKPNLDTMSFDDLYNNFKIVKQEIKGTTSSSSSLISTANLSDDIVYAFLASQPNRSQLVYEDLKQIHEDDIEEIDLKWQLALLSMRTRRGPRNQDSRNRNQDSSRRTTNVEETSSKAMVAIDGAGFDWSYMADEEVLTNMALMDFLDSKEFQQPEFQGYGPQTSKSVSKDISNEVRESHDALSVEELVLDDKLEKKTAFPTVAKIEFADCNYHQRERVVSGNNYTRVNYNYSAKKAHPSAHRNMVPRLVLMKTGLRSLNTARPINIAHPKTTVYSARPMPKAVNTDRPNSAVVNAVRTNQGHPQKEDQGYVDSGCSRHMTGNMSNLSDFKEFDRGYVTFKGGAKGGKITGKGTLKISNLDFEDVYFVKELQFNLFIPRKNNMYIVDMKNSVPKECLTCLVAKATLDESMLWHRRLGHFKNRVMSEFCKEKGIKKEFSAARTPQQNGVAKRRNRILIEAARTIKAFRIYNIRTRKVEENLHIRFLEDKPSIAGDGPKWLFDIDVLTKSMNYVSVVACTNSNDLVGTEESIGAGHSSKETGSSQDYILMQQWKDGLLFDSSSKNASNDEPQPFSDAGKKDDEGVNKESGIDDQERPKNSTQDINTTRPRINTTSTNANTGSLNINIVSPTLTTARLEATHVDFFSDEIEVDMSNITTTYLVPSTPNTRIHKDHSLNHVIGDGYTQEEGIDYDEVFAPVDRIKAIRLFLAYASFKEFLVYQIDVKSAFLYGKIDEEVYVCQPPGFKDLEFPDRVYKVEKALYGLHQAPRACVILLVQVYVDDVIFRSTKKELCTEFEKLMHKKFQMSSMGELTFFLGLQVTQKDDGIFISQDNLSMKDENAKDADVHLYRSMIGSLMYLTYSRPDIIYLKGQPKLGLWYPKDSPFDLEAYTDSDYAGLSLDKKSTIGDCQFLRSGLISWQCKKQTIVANSTTEAKYVAAARDSNKKKLIQMIKIYTDQNVADFLTKAFDVPIFQYLITSIERELVRIKIDDGNAFWNEIGVNAGDSVNAARHTLTTASLMISQDKYVADILRKFSFTDVRTASTPIDTEKPLLKDSDVAMMWIVTSLHSMIDSLMYLTIN
ncbi:putative ribonuclease H-like domain-containing protein [Tanacetum coccineum]